jgi:tetratricopeptide (TPR) repeat protein
MAAYHLQDYGEALHLLHRSLALFTTLDDMAAEAVICNSLGQVYEAIGELQTALYYYWDAMTFWKELGDRQGELYNLVCMAGAYRQEEMPFSALDAYRHAALLWSEIAPGEAIAQVEATYRDDDLEPILNAYQSIFSPVLEQFYLQFQELR